MKQYFSFNPHSHDFWPIYEAIKTYYPLGLKVHRDLRLYHEYEGQKKLDALLIENIHNPENFKERFVTFSDHIQERFNLSVLGTTFGHQPAFSLDIILERSEYPDVIKIKKLCLAISLLGDFYAIFGIDETIVVKNADPYPNHFYAVNAITVSPHYEFEQPYLDLKNLVQERYPTHKQVPFDILSSYLNGFYDKFALPSEGMIYNALFDQKLNNNFQLQIIGDVNYAYDEWLREGYDASDFKSVEVIVMPPPPIQFPHLK